MHCISNFVLKKKLRAHGRGYRYGHGHGYGYRRLQMFRVMTIVIDKSMHAMTIGSTTYIDV